VLTAENSLIAYNLRRPFVVIQPPVEDDCFADAGTNRHAGV
jgi:hypothetical protein